MIVGVILVVSFILDGILSNFLPYTVGNLSLFTPLLTMISLLVIYPFYRKKNTKYFAIAFISGILYDLFYTNLLFFNGILFLIIAYVVKFIYKNFEINYLNIILYVVAVVSIYEGLQSIFILMFNLVPITLGRLAYKISHSLLLNIIYVEIIYFIVKMIPNKYKKININ